MAELDLITIIIPVILSAIVSFIIIGINKLGKTSEGTLSGTIRLENVRTDLDGLTGQMDRGFDKLEKLMLQQERDNRAAFDKVWSKFEDINTEVRLHEYRLTQLDKRRNGNGGEKAAV